MQTKKRNLINLVTENNRIAPVPMASLSAYIQNCHNFTKAVSTQFDPKQEEINTSSDKEDS